MFHQTNLKVQAATQLSIIKNFARFLGLLGLFAFTGGCTQSMPAIPAPGENLSDEAAAEVTLVQFFEYLAAGDYPQAADLYAGPYDTMVAHNPGFDPGDHAGLFQAACSINGAVCLKVASAERLETGSPIEGEFVFRVQFQNGDGSLFVQGPCCGAEPGDEPAETQFIFRVQKVAEYLFQVIDPPVYQP